METFSHENRRTGKLFESHDFWRIVLGPRAAGCTVLINDPSAFFLSRFFLSRLSHAAAPMLVRLEQASQTHHKKHQPGHAIDCSETAAKPDQDVDEEGK